MSFISKNDEDNGQADKKLARNNNLRVRKRKMRATNEFIVTDILDESQSLSARSPKKNRLNNSILPKVDDVSLVPIVLLGTSKNVPQNKDKKGNILKLQKRKIEAARISKTKHRRNFPINRLKLKKAEGVWQSVKNNDENVKQKAIIRNLFVKLVPLEKTNLLTKDQLQILTKIDNMDCLSNKQVQPSFSVNEEISFSEYYRKSYVYLRRLPAALMEKPLKTSRNLNIVFHPQITSSPKPFINKSNPNIDMPNNLSCTEPTFSNCTLDRDCQNAFDVCDSPEQNVTVCKSSCTINKNNSDLPQLPNRKTFSPVDDNASAMNRTYEILPNEEVTKIMPKSMLKISTSRGNNNNRHVTFNNTSVIVIDDSVTFYESLVPTQFPSDDDDNGKGLKTEQLSTFNRNVTVRKTPAKLVLKNCNKFIKETVQKKAVKMPDYARIHKKMYDKMLNIQEYSKRKLQRAKLLLSGHKPNSSTKTVNSKHIENLTDILKKKSNIKKKLTYRNNTVLAHNNKKTTAYSFPQKVKKHENKNSVTRKEEAVATANKMPHLKSTLEKRKIEIKGVRTNRRFEMLMNLRRNQEKKN